MALAAQVITAIVLVIHLYIVLLGTVLFRTRGRQVFGFDAQRAELMAPLMSNQGCYNGFLVLALGLGLLLPDPALARAFTIYGLACVAVAGVWGAITAKPRILFVQTVPAVLGLAALWAA